uniref:RxLR effector candidate protein n=1 Tax=Peronospora matthiolae TaxID=2874970 RepID=A0AAV1USF4_9STRA
MRLRSAVLLLAATVAATKTDALQAGHPYSNSVDDTDDPVQRHHRTGHSESEERMYSGFDVSKAFKTRPFIDEMQAQYVAAEMSIPKFVYDWGYIDSVTQHLSNKEKKILVNHMWEPCTFSERGAKRFMERHAESTIVSTIKSLSRIDDVKIRIIRNRLRSILILWWKSQKSSAVEVFNLLQVDESALKAKEKATMIEKAICLADDPAFVMWTMFVDNVDEHDPIGTICRTLAPAYLKIEEVADIVSKAQSFVVGRLHDVRNQLPLNHHGRRVKNEGVYAMERLPIEHQRRQEREIQVWVPRNEYASSARVHTTKTRVWML